MCLMTISPVSIHSYLAFCSPELSQFDLPLLNSCNTRGHAEACLLNPHQREVNYQAVQDCVCGGLCLSRIQISRLSLLVNQPGY